MTDEPSTELLSFDAFRQILAEELAVPLDALQEGAAFIEDLQVDSLALASMMLRLEELGLSIPLERAWEIETVEDAYKAYCESRPSSPNP